MLKSIVAALCVLGLPTVAIADNFSLRVYNYSGRTVERVYVTEIDASDWGSDLLGDYRLRNNQYIDVNTDDLGRCSVDFEAVFMDGSTSTLNDFDICSTDSVTVN